MSAVSTGKLQVIKCKVIMLWRNKEEKKMSSKWTNGEM